MITAKPPQKISMIGSQAIIQTEIDDMNVSQGHFFDEVSDKERALKGVRLNK